MFAEGQFYLATQTRSDYISPGPWVDGVEVRVGVDTDGDKVVDEWTEWHSVKESYELVPGFSKQVSKTPAQLGLSVLSRRVRIPVRDSLGRYHRERGEADSGSYSNRF